jgi:UDP-galactopyranose mutase
MHSFPVNDLLVFSEARWDFGAERARAILLRMAKHRRVYYVEEPMFTGQLSLGVVTRECGVQVVVPQMPVGLSNEAVKMHLRVLLTKFVQANHIREFTAWYYSPAALEYSQALAPAEIIYDCLDEQKSENAKEAHAALLQVADVVFTPGPALREFLLGQHSNVHDIASGIQANHFKEARHCAIQPADQAVIPGPRIGFFGELDEYFDFNLLREAAEARPEWNFVLLSNVSKVPNLPSRKNIHYLGAKNFAELPRYLAGWDLAFLPLIRSEATRFLKPTRIAEYLAAGRPVVASSLREVVNPYGTERLIHIADNAQEFVRAAELAITESILERQWIKRVDAFLFSHNWDQVVTRMVRQENLARHAKIEAQRLLRQMAMETRLGA